MRNTLSDCKEIVLGVPHWSVVGPLIFNVFVNCIFLFLDALISVTMLTIQLSLHAI